MAVGKSFPTLMGGFIAFLVDILASLNKEIIIILSYFYSKPRKDVLLSTQSSPSSSACLPFRIQWDLTAWLV